MLLGALKLLRYGLGNPLSRRILSLGMDFCDDSQMRQLEHGMMIYLHKAEPHSLSCKVYSSLLSTLINTGLLVFDVGRSLFTEYFSEPASRRGFLAVLRGIA